MTIDHIMIPRLDWQDREFDQIQRAAKQLPRKVVFAGSYLHQQTKVMPMLMIYDREQAQKTKIKLFKSRGHITCVQFGPYDNGHILVGTSTGDFLAFDSVTLKKLCNLKLSDCPVTTITIEWTQLVLVGVQ